MSLEQVRKGKTKRIAYDLDAQTVELLMPCETYTFAEIKKLKNDIESVFKLAQPPRAASAPDDLSLSKPPWIFRKLFGWQNVIKRA